MRRMILVMTAGLLLVGAGVAVAHGFDSKSGQAGRAPRSPRRPRASCGRRPAPAPTARTRSRSGDVHRVRPSSTEPSLNGAGSNRGRELRQHDDRRRHGLGHAPHRHRRRPPHLGQLRRRAHARLGRRPRRWARAADRDESSCSRTSRPTTARPAASRTASSAAAPRPGDAILITPRRLPAAEAAEARARQGARRDHGRLVDVDQRRRRHLRRADRASRATSRS